MVQCKILFSPRRTRTIQRVLQRVYDRSKAAEVPTTKNIMKQKEKLGNLNHVKFQRITNITEHTVGTKFAALLGSLKPALPKVSIYMCMGR